MAYDEPSEAQVRELLTEAIHGSDSFDGATVASYSDAGILTMNEGLVLRLRNGGEYRVQIVCICRPERDEDNQSGEEPLGPDCGKPGHACWRCRAVLDGQPAERNEIREEQRGAWLAQDAAERVQRERNERNAWRQCPDCLLYTSDADHVCVTYDGPPCATCGEPTAIFTVDAPGYGTGRTCSNGHGEQLTRHGNEPPEQNP